MDTVRLPYLGAASFDISSRTVTTNVTAQADVMRVGLGYSHPNSPSRTWIVLAPVSATVTLPQLPSMFPVMPDAGDTGDVFAIGVYESNRYNGYSEARKDPLEVYNIIDGPVPPVGTTMRFSTWGLFP
ncbi:MAG: hypothetical protein H0T46_30455 [Deltaproteobacteria bacterium]|nr:hypothetical protein [Deltaproteobacteria bacterium]